jgi:hypothetical protein
MSHYVVHACAFDTDRVAALAVTVALAAIPQTTQFGHRCKLQRYGNGDCPSSS